MKNLFNKVLAFLGVQTTSKEQTKIAKQEKTIEELTAILLELKTSRRELVIKHLTSNEADDRFALSNSIGSLDESINRIFKTIGTMSFDLAIMKTTASATSEKKLFTAKGK